MLVLLYWKVSWLKEYEEAVLEYEQLQDTWFLLYDCKVVAILRCEMKYLQTQIQFQKLK